MSKSVSDLIMGVWTAPEVQLLVEYPLEIMEDLRALMCDEIRQLGRAGAGTAGILFGVSRGAAIRILAWRPISRTPPDEQSDRLSRNDRAEMVRVLGSAASDPAMQGFEPLGWFVSHTEGGRGLSGADVELFNNFFPNSWQVTLLLRRGTGGTVRAGFFVREPDGFLRPDGSYRELLIQPMRRVPGSPDPKSPPPPVPPLQDTSIPSSSAMPGTPGFSEPVLSPPVTSPLVSEETRAAAAETLLPEFDVPVAIQVTVSPHPPPPVQAAAAPEAKLQAERNDDLVSSATASSPVAADLPVQAFADTAASVEKLTARLAGLPPEAPASAATPRAEKPAPVTARPSAHSSSNIALGHPGPRPAPTVALQQPPALAAAELSAAEPETPSFTLQSHSFGGSRWLWVISVLFVLAVIGFLAMQKTKSPPTPSFTLRVGVVDDSVDISWDRDSIPVRNAERATIQIQDGSKSKQIALSPDQLRTGSTVYLRESGDIALQMTIYGAGNREYLEFARLVTQHASPAGTRPAPESLGTSELRTERDNLQTQVQLLKDQARKEAARADRAEDVVRILENRLKVDTGRKLEEKK